MSKVSLQNVSKFYPGKKRSVTAVRDFNLEVRDGEFLVLVGPSGCGKSTVLRMIAGLEAISEGDISIGDRVVNEVPPKDRDIAMVFQNYALYPHMSVFENMAFGLKLRKYPRAEIERRVRETAAILGIGEFLDRQPKALSGGQRQRVALGRAIVREPKVFLFDEPLSNLDASLRMQMRTEIIKLHRRLPTTMIYVTHDQVEAMTMGDRIVVMAAMENPLTGDREGVIQQIDKPLQIYREPINLFVAGFLGSPAMNLIPGVLHLEGQCLMFVEAGNGAIRVRLADRPAWRTYVDREVVLGVRPEDFTLDSSETNAEWETFPVLVEIIESLGAETQIHFQTGAHSAICRVQNQTPLPQIGQYFRVQFDMSRVLLFDPVSTNRIG